MNINNILHNQDEIISFFNNLISTNKPCFIGRIGGSDFELVCDYYNDPNIINNECWYKNAVRTVKELNGYFDFDNSKECFRRYLDSLILSYEDSDVLMYAGKMEKHIRFFIRRKSQINARFEPFLKHISQNKILINWNQFIQEVRPFLQSFSQWGENKKNKGEPPPYS